MTTNRKKQAKGLPKRFGNKVRTARRVKSIAGLPERKLRRILARNGKVAARTWAKQHMATGVLDRLVKKAS